jgi:methanogenic corrinoid protein MtbC1
VNTSIRLSDYATTPLYNIKAVVQATGISPSTLRAWERRYGMCQPQRSESGYRLYSDRDVAIIRWLKSQVDAGMAISQAVAWLESLSADPAGAEQPGVLPTAGVISRAPLPARAGRSGALTRAVALPGGISPVRDEVRGFDALRADLTQALVTFNELAAEQTMAEAFALYPIEQVGEALVMPVLVEIGERWQNNELSVTREHFATNYLLHRLTALLRTVPNLDGGPPIWIGCAPGEMHECGPVLLALYLRRAGYRVHYLGRNLPVDDFVDEVRRQQPALVMLSACIDASVAGLRQIAQQCTRLEMPRPLFGYGGRAFIQQPARRDEIPGVYMGDSAQDAVDTVHALLSGAPAAFRAHAPGTPS